VTTKFLWEEYYGKIWRELTLSKLGDMNSLENLFQYIDICHNLQLDYLSSLAATFYIISNRIFRTEQDNTEKMLKAYSKVIRVGNAGHIAQSGVAIFLSGIAKKEVIDINYIIDKLLECEGVKGELTLFYDFVTQVDANQYNNYRVNEVLSWVDKYVKPVMDYRVQKFEQINISDADTPKLKCTSCQNCDYNCCYDGVYIDKDDEERIKDAMENHPSYFSHITAPVFMEGSWKGLVSGRKTNVVEYNNGDKRVKHFNKTRCIFAYDDGGCALQYAAVKNFLNPWKYKPKTCCSFPIDIKRGVIVPPPTSKEEDSFYIDELYAGYASALPCCQKDAKGIKWSEKYKYEIQYLNNLTK